MLTAKLYRSLKAYPPGLFDRMEQGRYLASAGSENDKFDCGLRYACPSLVLLPPHLVGGDELFSYHLLLTTLRPGSWAT